MQVRETGFDELDRRFKAAPPLVKLWKQRELNTGKEKILSLTRGRVHVRSGDLRDSFEGEVSGDALTVYSDLDYAVYQEFGTYKMSPNPALIPSLMQYVTTLPASFLAMTKQVFW